MGESRNLIGEQACSGSCCCRLVYVTAFDLLRIRTHMNLVPQLFTLHYEESKSSASPVFSIGDYPCQMGFARGAGGECPFVLVFERKIRCGIFPLRPMACRIHPWEVADGGPVRSGDESCPDECGASPGGVGKLTLDLALEQCREEREYYGKIVDVWNRSRKPGYTFENFLEYSLQEAERAYDYYSAWRETLWR